eukprot:10584002-Prorocentrum_lima.AAC.1
MLSESKAQFTCPAIGTEDTYPRLTHFSQTGYPGIQELLQQLSRSRPNLKSVSAITNSALQELRA